MSTRNVPAGRWRKCLGRFKMQTLTAWPPCNAKVVSTRTAVGQFKGLSSRGRWMKVQGSSKYGTHVACNVTVDVAVIHTCCPTDDQATTLQVARARSETPLRQWRKRQGRGRRRAHMSRVVGIHVGIGQRCRAIDVESPAILPTMSTCNVPAGRWMTRCRAPDGESPAMLPTMSTRNVPAGCWMKLQGQFKGRAHRGSLIRVHVGVCQRCRAIDVESPAILPTTS
eukprot:scaffold13193_cov60-Phaeocystis_antarctica.AAC.3